MLTQEFLMIRIQKGSWKFERPATFLSYDTRVWHLQFSSRTFSGDISENDAFSLWIFSQIESYIKILTNLLSLSLTKSSQEISGDSNFYCSSSSLSSINNGRFFRKYFHSRSNSSFINTGCQTKSEIGVWSRSLQVRRLHDSYSRVFEILYFDHYALQDGECPIITSL